MIITRTPLRISFAGGGSDLPAFYSEEQGYVVSATIDKYLYLTINPKYDGEVRVSYSKTENVHAAREVEHPLVRAALDFVGIQRGIEIVSVADIPAGTGLGSSSAFTVGLLAALHAHAGGFATTDRLAQEACHVEIGMCRQPIGKQDQYAAAFGGLRGYTFHPDGAVSVEALVVPPEIRAAFAAHLLLVDTGLRREAGTILADQRARMRDREARGGVRALANLAHAFRGALMIGDMRECGQILDAAWQLKRGVAGGITTDTIDAWYTAAKQAGALGGKVCGAGGGGFLLLFAAPERHDPIRQALGLRDVPIRLVEHGATIIYG